MRESIPLHILKALKSNIIQCHCYNVVFVIVADGPNHLTITQGALKQKKTCRAAAGVDGRIVVRFQDAEWGNVLPKDPPSRAPRLPSATDHAAFVAGGRTHEGREPDMRGVN